jgi:hypothetical protein
MGELGCSSSSSSRLLECCNAILRTSSLFFFLLGLQGMYACFVVKLWGGMDCELVGGEELGM